MFIRKKKKKKCKSINDENEKKMKNFERNLKGLLETKFYSCFSKDKFVFENPRHKPILYYFICNYIAYFTILSCEIVP